MVEISVILPTYNRLPVLRRCLAALEEQTLNRARYEIIVVDDASTDGTAAAIAAHSGVTFLGQHHAAGAAAARNVAIRAAVGRYVLLLGDDILVGPQLLEQHLAAHAQARGEHVAVLGAVRWTTRAEITPLMRCLAGGHAFPQIRYDIIQDPDAVPPRFFRSSNLSLSRAFLLRHGLYDEDFRLAGSEDTDLAHRLQYRGLRVVFRREIVAERCAAPTYRCAREHTRLAGEMALLMSRKHPELADANLARAHAATTRASNWIERWMTETALDRVLDLADRRRWDHPLLARAYDWALRKHQLWGLMDALAHQPTPLPRPRYAST